MIKTWQQRCEEHPDHDGIVTERMIQARMQEEIDDLRAAIEQAQEPVAWVCPSWLNPDTRKWESESFAPEPIKGWIPLYTAPRQWQGLSPFDKTLLRTTYAPMKPLYYDKENDHSVCAEVVTDWDSFFAAIESKLQERNP